MKNCKLFSLTAKFILKNLYLFKRFAVAGQPVQQRYGRLPPASAELQRYWGQIFDLGAIL